MKLFIPIVISLSIFALTSCEKVIDIKLNPGTSQLAVDAFISDKPGTQVIKLTITSGYFNNAPSPAAINAIVKVRDNKNNVYDFIDVTGTGRYEWVPNIGDTLVRLGNSYTLSVTYNNTQFEAKSFAFPVPKIDSMNYELRKGNGPNSKESYRASFYGTDIKGMPNFYWIKSIVNGEYLNKPNDLILCQDAANGGDGADGLPFILPIREQINPEGGLEKGDTIAVEIHSIDPETFFFFQEVRQQTQNGGLFATPPANVSSNIVNVTTNSSVKAVGFFNVAMVSTFGIKIK